MTISTSVGKYLYAGELREKTHFMSREFKARCATMYKDQLAH